MIGQWYDKNRLYFGEKFTSAFGRFKSCVSKLTVQNVLNSNHVRFTGDKFQLIFDEFGKNFRRNFRNFEFYN